MPKSYYSILGVSSGASPDEIRSAYRRLAKEFHPDHFEGGSAHFRNIQEAYSVLGNARKRMEYEQSLAKIPIIRHAGKISHPEPEPLIPEQGAVDMGEIWLKGSFRTFTPSFDEFFEWLSNNFSGTDRPKSGRVQNLTIEIPLSRYQALRGGSANVMVPVQAVCPICRGTGETGYYECYRCAGAGAISGEMPISIKFPSFLGRDNTVVVPLERFGIRNTHMTVLFRVTDTY
ncbi:MAG: DnaJ domain-containing protein [Desulfobacterales bacterium]